MSPRPVADLNVGFPNSGVIKIRKTPVCKIFGHGRARYHGGDKLPTRVWARRSNARVRRGLGEGPNARARSFVEAGRAGTTPAP